MTLSMKGSPELTAEEVLALLITPLDQASRFLAAGPRVFDSPTGDPLRIPAFDSVEEAEWHGENEQITEADPDPNEVTLLPNNLKSVKVLHRFSNELARHSVISIATSMQKELVRKVAKKLDTAFFNGVDTLDGNGNRTPIGIANMAGIQTGSWAVDTTVGDAAMDAIGKFYAADLEDDSGWKFFVSPADFVTISKVKEATGSNRPLLQPDPASPGRRTLHGYPVIVTPKLSAGTAFLVDMNNIAVGRDLAPSVKLLDQTFGDYDQLALRVVARMDIAALHPEAIVKLTTG